MEGYFPALKDAKIVRSWAGCNDVCSNHVPGLIIATAFSGHGFGIAPVVRLLLSELEMGKKTTWDLSALRYDRFVAKN